MTNKRPHSVRKATTDPRVARTRQALGAALVELMLQHGFEEISVQQVLERAHVGRATFYAHFRNKHDLLLSDAERFFEMLERNFMASAAGSRRVAPVAELFAHVADYHHFQRALAQSEMSDAVHELLTGHLARIIQRRMVEVCPERRPGGLPPGVAARLFAAALVEMMRWWLERGAQPDASEMDRQFHALVWRGLGPAAPSAENA